MLCNVRFEWEIPLATHDIYIYIYTAAAKLLQSCLALCNTTDGSPPGSFVPEILQVRTGFSRQGCWSGLPFPSPLYIHIYTFFHCSLKGPKKQHTSGQEHN